MNFPDRAWEELKREFASLSSQAVKAARSELTKELNHSIRRLRQYQGEREWSSALIDALALFTPQAAVFELRNDQLALRRQVNFELPEDLEFPLASAPAFRSAIEAKDAVVALRSPSEVTEHLSRAGSAGRAHLLPIANGNRVVAVAFAADEGDADLNALELVVGIASAVLERQTNREIHGQIAPPPKIAATPAEQRNASHANATQANATQGNATQANATEGDRTDIPRARSLPRWA